MSEPDIPGFDPDDDFALAVAKPELKKPPMYKVIMLNDDYTPREFVVAVLRSVFRTTDDEAYNIMMTAHQKGVCVVAVYTREVAETKATQATEAGRSRCTPWRRAR